ncbi:MULTISPECIES: MBL fold metallo-hydrolase [unclassified Ornithinimicrobium]|uniref:MBL fold metallo-hydrolase n=1 Tax=unclassified Ornithinimicrobium TaxID=2615080 RepID=UPI003852ECF8
MSEDTPAPGHVIPGGASWTLPLGRATVRKCSVSEMDNNVYLVTCTRTGERLLVDAADDVDRLLSLVAEDDTPAARPGRLGQVLTTHRHWDHHRALPALVARTGAVTLAGSADADQLPVDVEVRLAHGDAVTVGDLALGVVALRGHTPGSVALELTVDDHPPVLFTGDSLFPGGPGKTWSAEDFARLVDDLEERVFAVYGDETLVLPGHGDNTLVGTERPNLDAWRARGW